MTDLINSAPEIDSTNLLNMMNVKYVVTTSPITSINYNLVYQNNFLEKERLKNKEISYSKIIQIYENKKFLPRAFLVPNCKVITTEKKYKETLESKNFIPQNFLLLDAEPKNYPCDGKKVPRKKEPVKIDSYESNSVELSFHSKERQFLILTDSFYPGWKAYVDGEEREILRANYIFRSIIIEPGKHQVRFEYDPLSFKLGLAISLLTVVICGGIFIAKNALQKKRLIHLHPKSTPIDRIN